MKSNVPDKPGPIREMPKCQPPKNPGRDKSKDAEIKMQMAKDILNQLIHSDQDAMIKLMLKGDLTPVSNVACDLAEQIFNRFHKGDE